MADNGERVLRPSSVETVLEQAQFHAYGTKEMLKRPGWVERYFPKVAVRGHFTHEDIDELDESQADAVRQLLANGVIYGRKRTRQQAVSGLSLIGPDPKDNTCGEWAIRVRMMEDALRDLCKAFGLRCPIE